MIKPLIPVAPIGWEMSAHGEIDVGPKYYRSENSTTWRPLQESPNPLKNWLYIKQKIKIDFMKHPLELNWFAKDGDGYWFGYQDKPFWDRKEQCWFNSDNGDMRILFTSEHPTGQYRTDHSLIERPSVVRYRGEEG